MFRDGQISTFCNVVTPYHNVHPFTLNPTLFFISIFNPNSHTQFTHSAMDFWQKARTFAEDAAKKSQELTKEAAKRSQEFTKEAAKRSQEFTIGSSKISDLVTEASKRSKEIAVEALKRADQIKSQIPSTSAAFSQLVVDSSPSSSSAANGGDATEDLEKFGITDDLREFVKEITINTFRDFPLQDDTEMSDIPTISNVRQDLTKWQEIHAKLVLSTVKEISKLRYELCPRVMRERKFWRIYFIIVNSHVTPYEKRYMEEENKKSAENIKEDAAAVESSTAETVSKPEASEANQKTKSTTTKTTDQDLDVFLLGDLGDSDDGPDDGNDDGLDDDDFDKL